MSAAALRLVPTAQAAPAGSDVLDEYEMFGHAAGWADSTIAARRRAVVQLAREVGARPEDVTARQFVHWMAGFKAPATRSSYYSHARSFYKWLSATGQRADDPTAALPSPRVPRNAPRPVRTADLQMALDNVKTAKSYAYIVLGAYAGLRIHEIAKIHGQDVDLVERTLRVNGKGGVIASLPMHPRVCRLAQGLPTDGYWFPSHSRTGHVQGDAVAASIERAFAKLGISMTAHRLRHWYGTQVLRSSGGNLRVAQELLRHSSPATTAIYTLVEDVERRRAIDKLV